MSGLSSEMALHGVVVNTGSATVPAAETIENTFEDVGAVLVISLLQVTTSKNGDIQPRFGVVIRVKTSDIIYYTDIIFFLLNIVFIDMVLSTSRYKG
jgi:hypothetical protein